MRTLLSTSVRALALACTLPALALVAMLTERVTASTGVALQLLPWFIVLSAVGVWPLLDARRWSAARVARAWAVALAGTPVIWLVVAVPLDPGAPFGEAVAVVVLLSLVVLPQFAVCIAVGAGIGTLVRRASGRQSVGSSTPA